ncbi:hypothetical protein HWV62_14276 [Athelia sp. TMB]|nr:hypothetical protein HWV62_14276 [Athelia sp. TMB]
MAHRPSSSLSNNNLAPPQRSTTQAQIQQRRMTSPSLPPPGALNLPEPVYGQREGSHSPRPPSPLRNNFVPQFADPVDSDEEDIQDDEDDWGPDKYRSTSPGASVTQFANNLANRVNSLLTSPVRPTSAASSTRSGHMTDAELEADAERERDQSRREAERILTQEANDRKAVEERVLALMHSPRGGGGPSPGMHDLAPPARSQTMPAASPPSPSASQKENAGGWWAAAKNKLTSAKDKEPLTPAQQVIHEAKVREQSGRTNGKGKEREAQGWFATDSSASLNLNLSLPDSNNLATPRNPVTPNSTSPNSSNNVFRPAPPPDLTPSPMRPAGSPSREPPPLYAQFNGAGTLDVAGTLLVIARRFEKLEKWTVGHVRALEERMSDVERWLVDKEKERERDKDKASLSTLDLNDAHSTNGSTKASAPAPAPTSASAPDNGKALEELHEIREEVTELQGRVGELGREVAKLATAPANLSSGPSLRSPAIIPGQLTPQASSTTISPAIVPRPLAPQSSSTTPARSASPPPVLPDLGLTPRRAPNFTARDSTSPPIAAPSPSASALSPNRRLPYPSGDYTSPPGSPPLPSVLSSTRPLNIPGLPQKDRDSGAGGSYTTASSLSSSVSSYGSLSIPRTASPSQSQSRGQSPGQSPAADSPSTRASKRMSSVSPTPRKRYTVALGGPITDPARRMASPPPRKDDDEDDDDDEEGEGRETIGKSAGRLMSASTPTPMSAADKRRLRTQSAYISPSPSKISKVEAEAPSPGTLNRLRSRSTDRFAPSQSLSSQSSTSSFASNRSETGGVFSGGKFVDPLVLRKQERANSKGKLPTATGGGVKKVPVGQLVAFFDKDR